MNSTFAPAHAATGSVEYKRVGDLDISEAYQRILLPHFVRQIAADFKPELVGIIICSYRDGRWWVVDGQHRVAALRELFGDGYVVACIVHYGMDSSDEARMFKQLNADRNPPSAIDLFWADIHAGDRSATEIHRAVVDRAGYRIPRHKSRTGERCVIAIAALRDIQRAWGVDMIVRVLGIIDQAWQGDDQAITKQMLLGLGLFLNHYGDKVNEKRLVQVLSTTPPQKIKREGMSMHEMGISSGRQGVAMSLTRAYNKGKRVGRLPDWPTSTDTDH